ncbi:MAG: endolytic transglycosylase MltG [Acidobacteria bacterium]|nr:endolytic transglycosylase MltG [Acidobacteriota bacterium]
MTPLRKRILVTVIAAPAIGLSWLLADGTRPYLKGPPPIIVDIPRGAGTVDIASQLESTGAIRSHWTFLGLHLLQSSSTLKAGEYSFEQPASTLQVLRKLIHGDVSYEVLTIPEGSNRFEIAEIVAAQGFSTREEFLRATEDPRPVVDLDPQARNLEGYLFPDTYHLPRHARPTEIVRGMVERFREVYAALRSAASDRPVREVVTIASLVEKETYVPSERPMIAGIFYNRLRRGLLLQADPSVAYATFLANGYTGRIRKSDLSIPSAYNTYTQNGLPPGPIANPGRASLRAAIQPAATEYLYFVANFDGGHVFSKTLAEHNLAVAQYRQDRQDQSATLKDKPAEASHP